MSEHKDILFEEVKGKAGNLGIAILNRPQALNSLNHKMINVLHKQLKQWETAKEIKAVIIKAVPGRAFCAGGDIRLTYERHKAKDDALVHFFRDEYLLNQFIFHYPKPYIALLDGITMGGGVGISIHGSHRIATDKLVFAMPETGIGFFPDVGGTYFLPRLPGKIGFYLGLTGNKINADDCVAIGLAQQKVETDALDAIIDAIAQCEFSHHANNDVSKIIKKFALECHDSVLLKQQKFIDSTFNEKSIEAILEKLNHSDHELYQQTAHILQKKSPTSLKVTLKALLEGEKLNFDKAMQQEFRLTSRFLQGHDFLEGIRALIIDKDQKPQWKPAVVKEVSVVAVDSYFAPLTHELA